MTLPRETCRLCGRPVGDVFYRLAVSKWWRPDAAPARKLDAAEPVTLCQECASEELNVEAPNNPKNP